LPKYLNLSSVAGNNNEDFKIDIYPQEIQMLFAGREVRIVVLKVRGHSFSLYGPTLRCKITYLLFSKLSNAKKLVKE